MILITPSPEYHEARALLDKLRSAPDSDSLGLKLALALGILIADIHPQGDAAYPIALAKLVILGGFNVRRAEMVLADCKGSA